MAPREKSFSTNKDRAQKDLNDLLWMGGSTEHDPAHSQAELSRRWAKILNCEQRTIQYWLSGKGGPSYFQFMQICKVAGWNEAAKVMRFEGWVFR